MNRGIVDAWTGVIREKPIAEIASRIHSESGGVSASQALECELCGVVGAIRDADVAISSVLKLHAET